MNPILSREIRVRFRDKRSFWLLFGLIALLCIAAGWIYAASVARFESVPNYYPPPSPYGTTPYSTYATSNPVIQRASITGRALFQLLSMGNVLAWLLVAPALTATGLAKERERGLLESLWLSPFKVRSQVLGRLAATLCFLLILQVAALPVYGIVVLLGGVSPQEIALAGVIVALAAVFGASLGLWFSARSYRSAGALGAVFVTVAVWSFCAFYVAQPLFYGASIGLFNFSLVFSHPVALMVLLLDPGSLTRYGTPLSFQTDTVFVFGISLQLILTFLLLWGAVRKAAKPLPDMRWSEGNTRLKKWKAALDAAKIERQERLERERASQKVAGALLYELPVEKFVRFKDPLLAREVRGRFRLRQSGLLIGVGRGIVFLFAVGFWLAVVFNIIDLSSRNGAGSLLLNGLLGFGILAVGVMSSTSLVREREGGTWEGLRLSLLPPLTLVRSKWLSPLITFAYWTAPLWILLPLCSRWNGKEGMALGTIIAAVLVIIAALGAVSAWGLWISSRAPHSAAATSWTLATLLVVLVGFPQIDSMLQIRWSVLSWFGYGYSSYYRYYPSPIYDGSSNEQSTVRQLLALLDSYHPFLTLENVYAGRAWITLGALPLHLGFCVLLSGLLLWRVVLRVRKTEGTERGS